MTIQKPTAEEIAACARTLGRLAPGTLPFAIFAQVTRLWVTSEVDLVILREKLTGIEVFLSRRPADCPWWPNMLHVPGTVVLATDTLGCYDDALRRINEKELGGVLQVADAKRVRSYTQDTVRGPSHMTLHTTEADPRLFIPGGEWFSVFDLPSDIIPHQVASIDECAEAF